MPTSTIILICVAVFGIVFTVIVMVGLKKIDTTHKKDAQDSTASNFSTNDNNQNDIDSQSGGYGSGSYDSGSAGDSGGSGGGE